MNGALSLFPAGSLACLTSRHLYTIVNLQPTRFRCSPLIKALTLVVSYYGLDTIPIQNGIRRCGVPSRFPYSGSTTTLALPSTV
jgi:hypothetical protein